MDLFKRLLFFAVVAVIGVFIFQNQGYLGQPVEMAFIKFRYLMALGFWLVLSFLAGALVWFALDLKRAFRITRELRRKETQVSEMQDMISELQGKITGLNGEIHNLKNAPLSRNPVKSDNAPTGSD